MSHTIALDFEDGVTRFIRCMGTESVVDAAYRQGINIPMDCREGACAACKCRVESGTYTPGEYIDDALSADEAAQGYALACQMRPTSDCVIRIPADSSVCKTRQESHTAQIKEVRRLSDSTFSLVLQGESLPKLLFLPGQYANLQVPGDGTHHRAYSFSALPASGDTVSFLIRNVPDGLMSGYLAKRAQPGDTMTLTGPFGSFYLRPVQRPVLMLAGGTGLAPFLAMLDKIAAAGGSPHPIHLIYGVNTDGDVVETARLDAFTRLISGFSYAVCVVDEHSHHPRKGYVMQYIEPAHLNDGDVDIYLCGPPPMVEAVSRHLREIGVESASFHYEKFAASTA